MKSTDPQRTRLIQARGKGERSDVPSPGYRRVLAAVACTAAMISWAWAPARAQALDVETRVQLQRTLQDYVEAKITDGGYSFFDTESGKVRQLKLDKLHPVIFEKDGYYLMCADFMDDSGADVVLDYIVRKRGDDFVVEQEIEGRRSFLTSVFEKVF